jgi:hypothetical protein
MNGFLYYLDKWTAWLDFSWLISHPKKQEATADAAAAAAAAAYAGNGAPPLYEPLLRK